MGFVEDTFGSKLIHADKAVDSKDLEGKYLGIYFSAHWCGPCRGFTPMLTKFYQHLKSVRSDFEFIFVSSDRDQNSFDEYYKEMPWMALKFEDRDRKSELSSKYGVSGIPTFVIVDKDGKTLTTAGRNKVMADPNGDSFPWAPKPLDQVIGNTFVNNKHEEIKVELKGKVFALYFSAHWCPPCKAFTPVFSELYKKLKAEGKDFEVVFVSSDRDRDSFEHYSSEMPWISIPFADQERRDQLSEIFEVEGIPSLIFIDKDLSVINDNGVSAVYEGVQFPFKPEIVSKLSRSNISEVNTRPSLFIVDDEESHHEEIKKALDLTCQNLLEEKKIPFKLYYTTSKDETFQMVSKFANISSFPCMFILDVPKQKKFVSDVTQFNADNIQSLVDDFLSKKLTLIQLR